jgi:hypothetical protein
VTKMGRPPIPVKRRLGRVYGARLRPDEERLVLDAIAASGKPQGEWIRKAVLRRQATDEPVD